MARLRASLASLSIFRSSGSIGRLVTGSTSSGSLQAGQRLAKPGLPGFNSNSSEQITQVLSGKGMTLLL